MLKVVVIDGNAISRDLLKTVLANGGYHLVGDSNASSAGLANMIKLQPQMVCIDIGQADEEGMAKLDTLRAALPKTLVFMVSGKIDPATIQSAIQRGVHGFIVKPFNAVTVQKTIRNAVFKLAKQHQQARTDDSTA
jgi:two-component system chemotaxis response regulator CheY